MTALTLCYCCLCFVAESPYGGTSDHNFVRRFDNAVRSRSAAEHHVARQGLWNVVKEAFRIIWNNVKVAAVVKLTSAAINLVFRFLSRRR